MNVARIVAIIFSLINALGMVWFIDTIQPFSLFFGGVSIACALMVSLTPRRLISNSAIRSVLMTLCIVGIISLFSLITKDYQRTYGPDYGAIIMRLLFAYIFVSIGLDIFRGEKVGQG